MNPDVLFLTVEDVMGLHREGLDIWGGQDGVRAHSELDSAVAMAQQAWDGEYLHEDLYAMAAAYAFHVAQNQPFIDGNKRAGAAAALVFLELNGISFGPGVDLKLYEALIQIANRQLKKDGLAQLLRDLPQV